MREKEKNGMYGRRHSPGTILKMSLARIGQGLGNQNARRYPHHPSSPEGIARYVAYKKEYYINNKEEILMKSKVRYYLPENLSKRKSHLKTRYGITDNDYHAMLARQGGGCAICKTIIPINGKGNLYFDVDHDHVTGKVRGLLCRDCNLTVGVVEKKSEKIRIIHEYLAIHVESDRMKEQKFLEKKV